MGIEKFEVYSKKLDRILDELETFCDSIEREVVNSLIKGQKDPEVEAITAKTQKMKTGRVCYNDESRATREKTIAFLYHHAICFLPTDIVKDNFPMSEKFLYNMIAIFNNKHVIHYSHVTGKILGYAHDFCNEHVRVNYYTIPVFALNQFRFDFFLFLKGVRPNMRETTGIDIGGKNPTDVNFAINRHQVRFIDTVKYFQQSLESLANSMTAVEREKI